MAEEKKQPSKTQGYFVIALGAVGVATWIFSGMNCSTVGLIKLVLSAGILGYGLWQTFIKKEANK